MGGGLGGYAARILIKPAAPSSQPEAEPRTGNAGTLDEFQRRGPGPPPPPAAGISYREAVEVKAEDKLTVGSTQTIDVGTTLKITAGTTVIIQVGGSKITMNQAGITIDAPTVTMKGQATAKLTSPMTTLTGSGITRSTAAS